MGANARPGYSERLFESGGLRSYLHNSRFEWFRRASAARIRSDISMVELGCFDGRLIRFCPTPPVRYEGFDADWEGGLSAAQEKFAKHSRWRFHKATDPSSMRSLPSDGFNLGASLETLEHVPEGLVGRYLAELARLIDGWLLVTVPNEKGLVFLSKWLAKKALGYKGEPYSAAEVVNATLGRLNRVRRLEHKGFDYRRLVDEMGRHFEVEAVEALPFDGLPVGCGFTVGIIARSR